MARFPGGTQTSELSGEMGQRFDKQESRNHRQAHADAFTDWSCSLGRMETSSTPYWGENRQHNVLSAGLSDGRGSYLSVYRHAFVSSLWSVTWLCWVSCWHSELNLLTLSRPELSMSDEDLSSQLTHNKLLCTWVAASGDAAEIHKMRDLWIPAVFSRKQNDPSAPFLTHWGGISSLWSFDPFLLFCSHSCLEWTLTCFTLPGSFCPPTPLWLLAPPWLVSPGASPVHVFPLYLDVLFWIFLHGFLDRSCGYLPVQTRSSFWCKLPSHENKPLTLFRI